MDECKIKTLHKTDSDITVESAEIYSYHIHAHSYYEMTLYQPFDGFITVNDQTIIPDTLTAILVAPSDFHKIVVNDNSNSNYIKVSFTDDFFDNNTIPKTSVILNSIKQDDFFIKLYKEILENRNNEAYKKALVNAAVCIVYQKGKNILIPNNTKQHRFGMEAVKILNESFNDNPTLSSVAKILSITPQHLSNTFKNDIGMTFSQYLTTIRLRRAEKILTETNESITKICDMCGYRNFSHFLRSFKKAYGVSPSVYRKTSTFHQYN